MSTVAEQGTFEYDIPRFMEPSSFAVALDRLVPGSVVSREGAHLVLRDVTHNTWTTRTAINELINPAQGD